MNHNKSKINISIIKFQKLMAMSQINSYMYHKIQSECLGTEPRGQ